MTISLLAGSHVSFFFFFPCEDHTYFWCVQFILTEASIVFINARKSLNSKGVRSHGRNECLFCLWLVANSGYCHYSSWFTVVEIIWQGKTFLTSVRHILSVFILCLIHSVPITMLFDCNLCDSLSQFAEQIFWLTSSGCSDDIEAGRNGTG